MSRESSKSIRLDLSRIDVVDFMEELGLRNVEDKGTEVFYSCPFPGHKRDDAHASASMSTDGSTKAYCFTCGWRGNALKFLADYEGVSPLVAARWIRQRFGDDFKEPEGSVLQEINSIFDASDTKYTESVYNTTIDEVEVVRRHEALKCNVTALNYMLDRGFSKEIMEEFGIGYDLISDRISIPYRDAVGRLVGFKGRAIREDQNPRYLVLGGPEYGFAPFSVGEYLFGLDRVLAHEDYKLAPICCVREGELNAVALAQHGYNLIVGISGKRLSERQVKILTENFGKASLWFDDPQDTINAAETLEPYMRTGLIWSAKDPAEMKFYEIEEAFIQAATLWDVRLPSDQ